MDTDNLLIRRLVRWNRFWMVLVSLYTLAAGYKYLEYRIISNASRLYVRWGQNEKGDPSLVFMSSGGPYVITHLVGGHMSTSLDAIAELPEPLFVRPKIPTYISAGQLNKMAWVEVDGKKVEPPNSNDRLRVLYYKVQDVITTE